MSQQNITNGPSNGEHGSYKSDLLKQEPPTPPPAHHDQTGSVRPALNRLDSRTNFIRPPFPNSQPLSPGSGGAGPPQVRPPQQVRPPGGQFMQRGPLLNLGGPQQGRPQGSALWPSATPPASQPYPLQQTQPYAQGQLRPNFRPPFSRSPLPPNQRPQIFQQRSVPTFGGNRQFLPEDTILRSQTLDQSELDTSRDADQLRSPMEPRPPSVNSNRSFNDSPNLSFEIRRQGSTGSLNHGSTHGSTENLNKDVPSRPGSRMGKILETGGVDLTNNTEQRRLNHQELPTVQSKFPEEDRIPTAQSKLPEQNKIPTAQSKSPEPNRIDVAKIVETRAEDLIEEKAEEARKQDAENIKNAEESKKANMELKLVKNIKKEGDNDSGVDESTQGNDRTTNGDPRSPRKGSKPRVSSTNPTARSSSRGSKTPSLKSPDSTATTPGSTSERKKLPMNKIQVGSAPSPNLKVVKSKIGSLQNASYKPGGGNVKIETKKIEIKATPRIEAKNEKYIPKGGEKKIVQQKLQWNAKSKIGSLENATYKPKGGDKKIESVKLEWKAQAKIGSKDNMKHQPGGGDVKIENRKLEIQAQSKIGSMDNVKHRPGGGEKKIFDDKDYLKQQKSGRGSMEHSLSGSQNSIPSQPDGRHHEADENLNQEHHKN